MDTRIPKPNVPPPRMYFIARRIAVVAVALAAVLSILLIANYIQTKSIDPLNSEAIARVMQQLQDDPQNEAADGQLSPKHTSIRISKTLTLLTPCCDVYAAVAQFPLDLISKPQSDSHAHRR